MLSPAVLDGIRATVAASFDKTATISRPTAGGDGMGGRAGGSAAVGTVACRLAPAGLTPQEREIAGKVREKATWRVTLPSGTDVRAADTLVIDGRHFAVVAPLNGRSQETCIRVVCVEAQ